MAQKSLTFTQQGSLWVATEQVVGDFAIHLDRNARGSITIDMTSVSGTDPQTKFETFEGESYDQEFACKFPKYLTIKSSSQPKSGKCYVVDGSEG